MKKALIEVEMIREDESSDIIINHLLKLKENFLHYFPPSADIHLDNMWILNPFLAHEINDLNPSDEELIKLSRTNCFKRSLTATRTIKFWKKLDNEYPNLSKKAIQLLSFATMYLAETAFSADFN